MAGDELDLDRLKEQRRQALSELRQLNQRIEQQERQRAEEQTFWKIVGGLQAFATAVGLAAVWEWVQSHRIQSASVTAVAVAAALLFMVLPNLGGDEPDPALPVLPNRVMPYAPPASTPEPTAEPPTEPPEDEPEPPAEEPPVDTEDVAAPDGNGDMPLEEPPQVTEPEPVATQPPDEPEPTRPPEEPEPTQPPEPTPTPSPKPTKPPRDTDERDCLIHVKVKPVVELCVDLRL